MTAESTCRCFRVVLCRNFATCTITNTEHVWWFLLFRSESPSQVFKIILQWLLALLKSSPAIPKVTLAYDNMCNLARLKVAQKPLALPPPLDMSWRNVEKVIDVFHFGNHVSPECKKNFNPEKLKSENPNFNTQAGEQTFVWVGRFRHINEQNPSFILPSPNGLSKKSLY